MASTTTSKWTCHICFEEAQYKVVGKCNHEVCLACTAKLRDLCEQTYCVICREELDKVVGVFHYNTEKFEVVESRCKVKSRNPSIMFLDAKILHEYRKFFANSCSICKIDCKEFENLSDHMRKFHDKRFCEICREHLKVFVKDLPVYSKGELSRHRTKGDGKSFKGHPLCEFCHERYLDAETLHFHLKKNHFWCHICEGQAFYCAYTDLKIHFKNKHFLCERGSCAGEQLTNVFRSEIDLNAHVSSKHRSELGKTQQRQLRRVELEYNFTNRPGSSRGSRYPPQVTDSFQELSSTWDHHVERPTSASRPNTSSQRPRINKPKPSSSGYSGSSGSSSNNSSGEVSSSSSYQRSPKVDKKISEVGQPPPSAESPATSEPESGAPKPPINKTNSRSRPKSNQGRGRASSGQTVWGGRGKAVARGTGRARKINKASTDFDDEDFGWFSQPPRRERSNERRRGGKAKGRKSPRPSEKNTSNKNPHDTHLRREDDAAQVKTNQMEDAAQFKTNQMEDAALVKTNQMEDAALVKTNQMEDAAQVKTNQMKDSEQNKTNQMEDAEKVKTNQMEDAAQVKTNQMEPAATVKAPEKPPNKAPPLPAAEDNLSSEGVPNETSESLLDALTSSKPPSLEEIVQSSKPPDPAPNSSLEPTVTTSKWDIGTAPETPEKPKNKNLVSELQSISRNLLNQTSDMSLQDASKQDQQPQQNGVLSYSDSVDPNRTLNYNDFPPLGGTPNVVCDWKVKHSDLSSLSGGSGRGRARNKTKYSKVGNAVFAGGSSSSSSPFSSFGIPPSGGTDNNAPPGFDTTRNPINGNHFSYHHDESKPPGITSTPYIEVPNFCERQRHHEVNVQSLLGPHIYLQWQMVVDAFRERKINANAFVRIATKHVEKSIRELLLMELTVLLPDIELQNQLYNEITQPNPLIRCTRCNQILAKDMVPYHLQQHASRDNPLLITNGSNHKTELRTKCQ